MLAGQAWAVRTPSWWCVQPPARPGRLWSLTPPHLARDPAHPFLGSCWVSLASTCADKRTVSVPGLASDHRALILSEARKLGLQRMGEQWGPPSSRELSFTYLLKKYFLSIYHVPSGDLGPCREEKQPCGAAVWQRKRILVKQSHKQVGNAAMTSAAWHCQCVYQVSQLGAQGRLLRRNDV